MLWLLFFKLYCSPQFNICEELKDSEVDKKTKFTDRGINIPNNIFFIN